MCPAMSYTAGWVKVPNPQVKAQKPQLTESATPQTRSGSNPAGGTHLEQQVTAAIARHCVGRFRRASSPRVSAVPVRDLGGRQAVTSIALVRVSSKSALRTTAATSIRMAGQSSRDTKIELRLRSRLHAGGLRYRVHQRPLRDRRCVADVVFTQAKVAVFVDGCFWHGCPLHGTWPKRNADFWREKIEANVRRDRETDASLVDAGWASVRVWEHEDAQEAADRIVAIVRSRRATK